MNLFKTPTHFRALVLFLSFLIATPVFSTDMDRTVGQLLDDVEKFRKSKETGPMLEAIHKILGKDKDNMKALIALAGYHIEKNNRGLARLILERAGAIDKKEPAVLNNYGVVDLLDGDERAAIANFLGAARLQKDYEIGASNLGSIYIKYRDYKRSLKPLEDAYTITRSGLKGGNELSVEIANNYAVALLALGEPKIALKIFDNIADGESRNPRVLLNHARLLVDVLKDRKEGYRVISKLKFLTDNQKILREVEALEKRVDKLE